MAEAKATFTTSDVWDDSKRVHAIGRLTVTASPDTYTTGGIVFNVLSGSVDGAGMGLPLPTVQQQPVWSNIIGGFYSGLYIPSINKLLFRVNVGGAEVASGAIPAGLNSDTITAYFIFKKF